MIRFLVVVAAYGYALAVLLGVFSDAPELTDADIVHAVIAMLVGVAALYSPSDEP